MAKRRSQSKSDRKRSGLAPEELRSQEGLELPNRHAMSLLTGLPSLGGGGLLGGAAGGTAPTDGTTPPTTGTGTPDPGTAAPPPTHGADTTTFAPVNKATILNQMSSGSTQGAGSTQTTPITQGS